MTASTTTAGTTSTATATWEGGLRNGKGEFNAKSGAFQGSYSFHTRFEGAQGTNPEELIAAAHAGCFAMQLSHFLAEAGHPATKLSVDAEVTIGPAPGGGQAISKSALALRGDVPGMSEAQFLELANKAKAGCPVSKALSAIEITLDARLES